jgi:hypothetical protein
MKSVAESYWRCHIEKDVRFQDGSEAQQTTLPDLVAQYAA